MSLVVATEAKANLSPKEATKRLFDMAMMKSEDAKKSANNETEKMRREERLKDRDIIAKALYSGDLDARDFLLELKENIDSVKNEKDATKIIYLTRAIMEDAYSEVRNAFLNVEKDNKKPADTRTRDAVYSLKCENAKGKGILDVKRELYSEFQDTLKRKPDETDEDYAKRGAHAAIHVIRILDITGAIGISNVNAATAKPKVPTTREEKEQFEEEGKRQVANTFMPGILAALLGSKENSTILQMQPVVEMVKDEIRKAGSPSDTGLEAVIKLLKQKMDADLK